VDGNSRPIDGASFTLDRGTELREEHPRALVWQVTELGHPARALRPGPHTTSSRKLFVVGPVIGRNWPALQPRAPTCSANIGCRLPDMREGTSGANRCDPLDLVFRGKNAARACRGEHLAGRSGSRFARPTSGCARSAAPGRNDRDRQRPWEAAVSQKARRQRLGQAWADLGRDSALWRTEEAAHHHRADGRGSACCSVFAAAAGLLLSLPGVIDVRLRDRQGDRPCSVHEFAAPETTRGFDSLDGTTSTIAGGARTPQALPGFF